MSEPWNEPTYPPARYSLISLIETWCEVETSTTGETWLPIRILDTDGYSAVLHFNNSLDAWEYATQHQHNFAHIRVVKLRAEITRTPFPPISDLAGADDTC